MRVSVQDQQFELYFQPMIDLSTGRFSKAEALIRWNHPERGMISPAEFIPLAEETGLILEIGLNASKDVTDKLLLFRDAGIEVAIDDFGVGYSALSYLKRFDIDYLKIDQSFIQNLETEQNDLVLSEAIVIMAHKLGLKVIAEGVETEGQRRLLLEIGCDNGQGYLFSRPLPAAEFENFLVKARDRPD